MGRRLTLAERLNRLPALYTTEKDTDEERGRRKAVYVFTPDAQATWILLEFDPAEGIAFGWCDLGLGFPEVGYVDLASLEALRGRFGLPVEVDARLDTYAKGLENVGARSR